MKKAFLLYADFFDYFEALTDDELGKVIRAVFAYQKAGTIPTFDDRALKIVFDLIKNQIDRDFEKWTAATEKRKAAAKKRWEQKAQEQTPTDQAATIAEEVPTVSEVVKDTATEEPTEEKKALKRFKKPSVDEIAAYVLEQKFDFAPQQFFDFYESKGWKVGNSPMKDWKAAARTWQTRANTYTPPQHSPPQISADKNMDMEKLADYFGIKTGAQLCQQN